MIAGIGDLGSDDLSLSGTEYSNSNFPEWNLVVWNRKANCFAIYDLQDSQLCKSLTWLFQGGEKKIATVRVAEDVTRKAKRIIAAASSLLSDPRTFAKCADYRHNTAHNPERSQRPGRECVLWLQRGTAPNVCHLWLYDRSTSKHKVGCSLLLPRDVCMHACTRYLAMRIHHTYQFQRYAYIVVCILYCMCRYAREIIMQCFCGCIYHYIFEHSSTPPLHTLLTQDNCWCPKWNCIRFLGGQHRSYLHVSGQPWTVQWIDGKWYRF